MKRERAEALPTLEALFKLVHMPRNGYVFLRFPKTIASAGVRTIWTKHIMCWYHFVCFVFYNYTQRGLRYNERHWAGDTDEEALTNVLTGRINTAFELLRVSDYDGRYRSECYYCNGRTKRGRHRAMCGEVPYTNGPSHG